MGGFLTFLLVRFRKTESIMADEEAEVYEEEEERVEEEVEEEPEPEPEPVKEPTPPPPPAPKKKAAKKAPEPEPEEEASGAAGLAKYSPSGEVDQYGFPVIPIGKRTPIKVLGSKLSNILRYKRTLKSLRNSWTLRSRTSSCPASSPSVSRVSTTTHFAREPRPSTKPSGISKLTATIINRNSRDRITT